MDLDAIIHFRALFSPACFFLSVDPAELRCYSKIGASRGENNIPYPSEWMEQ